jgi:hypothetical protein
MIGYHAQLLNGNFENLKEIEVQQEPCGTVESSVVVGSKRYPLVEAATHAFLFSCFLVQSMGWSCGCGGAKVTQQPVDQ